MYSVNNVESLSFIGAPYNLNDLCFLYPLKVGEVIALNDKYEAHLFLLTINDRIVEKLIKKQKKNLKKENYPTPFEYLLEGCEADGNFLLEIEKAFFTFIKEEVTILPVLKKIVIGNSKDKRFLDESSFLEFQNILRIQNKVPGVEEIPENESPIARKFREKRELRDEIKRKQESKSAPTFSSLLGAVCAYKVGITPLNIKDITIYAFYSLLQINGSKERYETEMNYIYAGADPKKLKPKYWITNN